MVIEDEETVPYGYLVADEKEVKVEYAQTIDATYSTTSRQALSQFTRLQRGRRISRVSSST